MYVCKSALQFSKVIEEMQPIPGDFGGLDKAGWTGCQHIIGYTHIQTH